jgi:hypothetical protein
MTRLRATITAEEFLPQAHKSNFVRGTHFMTKGKTMGIPTATARNIFVCLSFFFLLVFSTVPLRPVWAQSQKPTVSYEEKKRQANDIAVTVVVSGISCTCARFAEDIRNVVNDLTPFSVSADFKT